ncbi:MAG: phosphotransferase [Lachnospiraceae bacterium]|nr:phosphotransferase [Lachnospiraceae bacterium]
MDSKQIAKQKAMNERINTLRQDEAEFSFSAHQYAREQKQEAQQSVQKAKQDNVAIDLALEQAEAFRLNLSEKARLESIRGRNLSHILLNNNRFKKDSPEMEAVKNAVAEVEMVIDAPIVTDYSMTGPGEEQYGRAISLGRAEGLYQEAIVACRNYLLKKSPITSKGIERYNQVRQQMNFMMKEAANLAMAKQLMFRGLIGKNAKTVRELLVEQKSSMNKVGIVGKKEKERYEKANDRLKTFNDVTRQTMITSDDEENFSPEMNIYFEALTQKKLPNALMDMLGEKKEDRQKAVTILKNMHKRLRELKEDRFTSVSFLAGDTVIHIFQKEDNTLDFGYTVRTVDKTVDPPQERIQFKQRNLEISARELAARMSENLIENEEVFGKEYSAEIVDKLELLDDKMSTLEKSRATNAATAFLCTRLKLAKSDLANIPQDERVKLAKALNVGFVTEEYAKQYLKDYELGNKYEKQAKKKNKLDKLNTKKDELDAFARSQGYADMEAMIREQQEKDELRRLTEEENAKLLHEKEEQERIRQEIENAELRREQEKEAKLQADQEKRKQEAAEEEKKRAEAKKKRKQEKAKEEAEKEKKEIKKAGKEIARDFIDQLFAEIEEQEETEKELKEAGLDGLLDDLFAEAQEKVAKKQADEKREKKLKKQAAKEDRRKKRERRAEIEELERKAEESLAKKEVEKREMDHYEMENLGVSELVDDLLGDVNEEIKKDKEAADLESVPEHLRGLYQYERNQLLLAMAGKSAGQEELRRQQKELQDKLDASAAKEREDLQRIREENETALKVRTENAQQRAYEIDAEYQEQMEILEERLEDTFKTSRERDEDGRMTHAAVVAEEQIRKETAKLEEQRNAKLALLDEELEDYVRMQEKRVEKWQKRVERKQQAMSEEIAKLTIAIEQSGKYGNCSEEELEAEWEKFDQWREYLIGTGKYTGMIRLSFDQWKEKLQADTRKFQEETEERIRREEERKQKMEEYRDVTEDIRELEEGELSTLTDERVNGAETLELLKNRKKCEQNGTLKTMVVYSEDLELEEEAKEEERRKRLIKESDRDLPEATRRVEENEERLAECKKKQEAAQKKLKELEAEKTKIAGLPADSEENAERLEQLTGMDQDELIDDLMNDVVRQEGGEMELILKHQAIRQGSVSEIQKEYDAQVALLDERVASKKLGAKAAEERKKKLKAELQERVRVLEEPEFLLAEELESTLGDKYLASEEYAERLQAFRKKHEEEKASALKVYRDEYERVLQNLKTVFDPKAEQKAAEKYDRETKKLEAKYKKAQIENEDLLRAEYVEKLKEINGKAVEKKTAKKKAAAEREEKLSRIEIEILQTMDEVEKLGKERQDLTRAGASLRTVRAQLESTKQESEEKLKKIEQDRKNRVTLKKLEAERKQQAIQEGTAWTEDEEALKDMLAEFIYARDTWEMDEEKKPGLRLWNVLQKNQKLLTMLIANPQGFKQVTDGFIQKLPVEFMGMKPEELSSIIDNSAKIVQDMARAQIKEMREQVAKRKKEREKRVADKTAEVAERKKARAEAKAKPKPEEVKKAQEEAKKQLAEYEQYLKEHRDFSPLEELERLEELKKQAGIGQTVPVKQEAKKEQASGGGFFGFFSNMFKTETEEERQEREENEAWEKEIEEAGQDEYLEDDKKLEWMPDYMLLCAAVNKTLNETPLEENTYLQKLAEQEAELEEQMHKQIRGLKKIMKQYVQDNFSGEGKEEEIGQVEYYREKGISKEERDRRIKAGNDELDKMINNALVGEEGQGQFLRNILSDYLSGCNNLDLRSMLSSAIRNAKPAKLSKDATDEEKLKAVSSYVGGALKGAGPLLQKTLQGVPESMIPKGLEEAMEDMKSNLAPIPKEIVEAELLGIVQRSDGQIRRIAITKSLGAASVGQAFLCRVYMKDSENYGRPVVIKLLRPDVRNRMMREEKILNKCAADAGEGMRKTFEGQMERIREELDLTIEAKNCELGMIYDDDQNDVKAMKVSREANPTTNSLMVDRADGDTVVGVLKSSRQLRDVLLNSFYTKNKDGKIEMEGSNPKLSIPLGSDVQEIKAQLSRHLDTLQKQQGMLCEMARKWVDEAIFGKGFYHGDLHAGNIMMSDRKLTIIDFGNATMLDEFQRTQVTKMLMAAAGGSGSGFMDGFEALLSDSSKELLKTKRAELEAVFQEVLHLGDFNSSAQRIAAVLVRAQKLGFELPPAIYGFQQCQLRVQNTIEDFNKEITAVQDALKTLEDVQKNTLFDVKKKHDKMLHSGSDSAQSLRIALLPNDEEQLLKLIRDKSEGSRLTLDKAFGNQIEFISLRQEQTTDEALEEALLNYYGGEGGEYRSICWDFISREKWTKVFTDKNIPIKTGNYGIREKNPAYEKAVAKLSEKDRKEIVAGIRELYEAVNVKAALKELHKAQDAGAGEDVLAPLEQKVLEKIRNAKESYMSQRDAAYENDVLLNSELSDIEDDWDELDEEEQKDEKIIKQFEDRRKKAQDKKKEEIAKRKKEYDPDEQLKDVKESLKDAKKLDQAANELKALFEEPAFGAELRAAFNAYREAVKNNAPEDQKEELLNRFLDCYKLPLLKTIVIGNENSSREYAIDYSKPKDFVGVMGNVIGDKWKTALKRMNIFKAIKYGWRIREDEAGKLLGIKDVYKDIMDIIFDREQEQEQK